MSTTGLRMRCLMDAAQQQQELSVRVGLSVMASKEAAATAPGVPATLTNVISTVFTPVPSCLATTNIWQTTGPCNLFYDDPGETSSCTYFLQGGPRQDGACFPPTAGSSASTVYTKCPISYTTACTSLLPEVFSAFTASGGISGLSFAAVCCPM